MASSGFESVWPVGGAMVMLAANRIAYDLITTRCSINSLPARAGKRNTQLP
jgi:hypothetical protein